MGEVVNLNRFRKRRQRKQAERTAADNRRKHGRTHAERAAERDQRERAAKRLDQHHLGQPRPDPSDTPRPDSDS